MICDSRILVICSKLLGNPIKEAIPGSSFFPHFYMHHKDDENCKIFLLGAMDGVANKAMENINKKVGREIVVGAYSPSYGFEKKQDENENIYKMINDSGANVVLVGVGCPKQEKWIDVHKEKMPNVDIWMALGATIDFEAGNIKRAPKWVQKIAMEWFYRQHHPEYRPLPPPLPGSPAGDSRVPMEFIWPEDGSSVAIPRQLDGSLKGIVCNLAHSDASAEVFWHLDNRYLGCTRQIHQMQMLPSAGDHVITVTDSRGNTLSVKITIVPTGQNRPAAISSR